MKRFCLILLAAGLGFATVSRAEEAGEEMLEITSRDGRVFREATVERLTPSCVDIGYVKEDGTYAMIGLPLAQLTGEWQKKFNYDPEKAKAFEERVKNAGRRNMVETAQAEADRMARVTREVKAKLSGEDVQIRPADLRFAIYGRRRPVVVVPVEKVKTGTVVAIREDTSGLAELPALILLDGLDLEAGSGNWSGFIFPTGMKARYKDRSDVPVFSDSLDDAQTLLERYLEIYSEFAAREKDNAAEPETTAPPDQAPAAPAGVAGIDNKGGNIPFYSWDSYYLGGSYYPVVWYYNRNPIYYYPQFDRPRPRPPRPPQPCPPPRPQPQPQPPQPQPGPLSTPRGIEQRGNFRQAVPRSGGVRILPPTGPVSGGR